MSTIPERFPATGTDIGVSITRAVTLHRIGALLRFPRHLDELRLTRAVRLTLDAEPILGCRFVTEVKHPYWERLDGLDSRIPFTLVHTCDTDATVVAFQAEEVRDSDPQVAILLARTAGHDALGVKLSHVVADGQAVKQYLYLLAEIYSRLAGDPSFTPESNLTPRPTESDVWVNLSEEQRRAAKKASAYTFPNWVIPYGANTGADMTYATHALAPERLASVKEYGVERGATVNDMLLTAFFRACVTAFDPPCGKKLSLMSTADHRRFLPSPERLPIANISISGALGIERIDGEGFDATLERVRRSMAAWAGTSYGAAAARNAERLARLSYRNAQRFMSVMFKMGGSGKTYPWFTNIGVIDDGRLDFDGLTPEAAHLFGPVVGGPSVIPAISTYRGTVTVCMGWCRRDFDAGIISQVLGLLDAELPGR